MKSFNVIFTPLTENDLSLLHQWFQIPHVLKWYAKDEKYSLEMLRAKYLPRVNDPSISSFIIYEQDKPVGYIQFYHVIDHLPEGIIDDSHPLLSEYKLNELAGIDLFIADKNYLRTGFSSEVLELFINTYIKGKFKAVLVDPLKQNTVAISFFEKNGFKNIMSQDKNHNLMILELANKT